MTEPPRGRGRAARTQPLSIDVAAIARGTVDSPRPNLVTRPTGRAVREAIEARLVHITRSLSVALIDLTRVRILDFSCADEVVAKLLLRYLEPDRPGDTFFLFRTVGDLHRHAVGEVLGRHGLAAVCDFGDGRFQLLGPASSEERAAWTTLERRERILPGDFQSALGDQGESLLQGLAARRLAHQSVDGSTAALSALARKMKLDNHVEGR